MNLESFAAVGAATCVFVALFLFMRDVRRGTAKPYAWAWVIRIGIVALAFAAQAAKGATHSLALSGAQLGGGLLLLVYIFATQRQLGRLDKLDIACLGCAFAGLGLWLASGNAAFAALGVIAADAAATAMGVRAALAKNQTDSLPFWLWCLAASFLAASTVSGLPLSAALIPMASLANALVNIGVILFVRSRSRRPSLLLQEAMSE